MLLFVRMEKKLPNSLAEPFLFLGPVRLRSHQGARLMQIEWKLESEMPAWLYERGAVLGR